jgi:serine phosphatase RsbU (regulator of sigma subunit)
MAVLTRSELSQFIRRQADARALVTSISDAIGATVSIEDSDGTLLHGGPLPATGVSRFPVKLADASIGYVGGAEGARAVAQLLEHLLSKSAEQKALGAEVLHLYREINLIYSFSEKLAALLDLDRVARLTLQEARTLIVATDGVVMLLDDETGELTSIASFGDEMRALPSFRPGQGIVGTIAATGIGEIVNDLHHDSRRVTEQTYLRALICAPLKIGEKVIGVLALGSTLPMAYTAAELKLLNTLALQTATAIENARLFERTIQAARERERLLALHQEAEIARAKLESEMKLAARIQQDLFPAQLPPIEGYELAARNRPARRCGGDYYDALTRVTAEGDDRLLLCVADVAGKGLPASLVMSNMQATLRALLGDFRSLPALASHASDLLYNSTSAEKYVTAALAELSPATGAVHFVGAGHLDNVIVRVDGTVERLSSTGAPLGLLPAGLPYGQTDQVLHPGDVLVLFSDGVTDAQDAADEEFGEPRLLDVLASTAAHDAETVIDRIFAAIDAFAGGAPQFDDMTILVARRL